MPTRTRSWGFVVRLLGYPVAVAAVPLFTNDHLIPAALALVAGVALVVAGSMIGPVTSTGAHFARFAMETNNELHMVKPPGENVLDLVEGDRRGRFRGR